MQILEGKVWTDLEGYSQDCRWLTLSWSVTAWYWAFLNSFSPRWEGNLLMFHLAACSQTHHDSYTSQATHTNFLAACVWNGLSFVIVLLVVNCMSCLLLLSETAATLHHTWLFAFLFRMENLSAWSFGCAFSPQLCWLPSHCCFSGPHSWLQAAAVFMGLERSHYISKLSKCFLFSLISLNTIGVWLVSA